MSKEAIKHYETALKEAFPSGATGDVFHHWNEARKALAEQPAQQEPWGACVSGRVFVGRLPEHARKLSEDEGVPIQWLYTSPQPAQQEQVAWMWRCKPYCGWPEWSVSLKRPADSGRDGHRRTEGYEDVALYTSPQPAQRKPLTDKEIYKIANDLFYGNGPCDTLAMCRAIEAAHGIKE